MSNEETSDGSDVVSWIFVVLFLIFHWGSMDWVDVATLIHDRKELLLEKFIYTLPLNLSFGFAFILATSVKRYTKWHFLANSVFFTIITGVFNAKGWLNPAIEISNSGTMYMRTYHLLLEYFDHFGLFDFLCSLLIAIYLTYYWHVKIMETDFESD